MRFPRKQQGAAAVELGFLLIPLVLLAFGVSEYGRAVYQYNTLVKASRDAARYLSAQAPSSATSISSVSRFQVSCGFTVRFSTSSQGMSMTRATPM